MRCAGDEEEREELWESLLEHLQRNLTRLLTRFRSDHRSLPIVLDLLPCLRLDPRNGSGSGGGTNARVMKPLLKVVAEVVETSRDEEVTLKAVQGLKAWLQAEGSRGLVHDSVGGLIASAIDRVTDAVGRLRTMGDGKAGAGGTDGAAKRRRVSAGGGSVSSVSCSSSSEKHRATKVRATPVCMCFARRPFLPVMF